MPEKCFLQLIRFASENVAKGKTQKEFLNTRFKHLFSSNAFTSTTIRFTFVHMCIYVILCNIKLWGGVTRSGGRRDGHRSKENFFDSIGGRCYDHNAIFDNFRRKNWRFYSKPML
jgi:hypothetical protein